ncbi:MAG: adenine deaminase [Deltaproteobacteria bacterium]|nr:adenine deaminase [Deltaproteobacteria bacterium]
MILNKPLTAARLRRLMQTARGQLPADAVIENISLVNVYSGEILPNQSVALSGDRIVRVDEKRSGMTGPKTRVTDGRGGYLLPGFIDAHTHLDSIFTCAEFAPYALATGNTTAVTEMAMAANVLGTAGIEWFIDEAAATLMRIFFLAPALTPPFPELETSQGMDRKAFRRILNRPEVLGVGESYWPRVVGEDPRVLAAYVGAHGLGKTREGHAAGARGENLSAYTTAGTTSCHEATTLEEALERLRLGLGVMIREGFVRREFPAIAPLLTQGFDLHRVMLVSDLFDPADLVQGRGMNALLAQAVAAGCPPVTAVQLVTRNVADYYHLRDLGGIAPGKLADLVLVEDLRSFNCRQVWVNGQLAVDEGRPLAGPAPFQYPLEARQTFSVPPIQPEIFSLPAAGREITLRAVRISNQTITRGNTVRLAVQKGQIPSDPRQDVLKAAVFQRRDAVPRPALGFAQGIGLKQGAVATSFTWDAGNLLVIGVSDREMALAVNRLLDLGGGLVVAAGERIVAEMPMPILGLISEQPLPELVNQIKALEQAFRTLGSGLERPFLTLQTFCFTGLPFIRLTDKGLADVREKKLIDLFLEKED